MASTVIQPVADRLKVLLEGITVNGQTLKVPTDAWARDHLQVPGAEIEVPDVTRQDVDAAESQLGSNDWYFDFLVSIWWDLREATASQKRLVEALEKWIAAVDGDQTLNNLSGVNDTKVVSAQRVYELQENRTLVGYETTVRVWRLV